MTWQEALQTLEAAGLSRAAAMNLIRAGEENGASYESIVKPYIPTVPAPSSPSATGPLDSIISRLVGSVLDNPKVSGALSSATAAASGGITPDQLSEFEFAIAEAYGAVPLPDGNYLVNGRVYSFDDIVGGALANESNIGGSGGSGAGTALGYAQLGESQRQFDLQHDLDNRQFAEDVRQFGVDEAYRRDALRQDGAQFAEDLQFRKSQLGENARQFDAQLGEDQYQFDNTFGENQYQFDNTQSRLLEGMRRERSLAENDWVAGVLRNPSDFLARAFLQRGVSSPMQALSQADLIEAMRASIAGAIPEYTTRDQYSYSRNTDAPTASPPPQQYETLYNFDADIYGGQKNPDGSVTTTTQGGTPVTHSADFMNLVNSNPDLKAQVDRWYTAGEGNPMTAQRPIVSAAGGGVTSRMAVVGERGPELVATVPGGFAVMNQEQLGFNPMDLNAPRAATGGMFTSPLLNISSQQDIVNTAKQYAPPAVSALLGDSGQSVESLPLNLPVRSASFRQTNLLTPDEVEALGTRLAAENVNLSEYATKQNQLFGNVRSRRKGRLLT